MLAVETAGRDVVSAEECKRDRSNFQSSLPGGKANARVKQLDLSRLIAPRLIAPEWEKVVVQFEK
jgi:hypothetical protein